MLFNRILNAFADVDLTTELGELAVILTRDPTTYTDEMSQIIQYSNISQQNNIYFQPHCIVTPNFLTLWPTILYSALIAGDDQGMQSIYIKLKIS